ncbi:DVUA0089 family protein [Thalassotalea litorea]|uniref:DVUA0089 family protein n=1 Tax=Thalassotalea litorea TaxID=2020715 RepID=UPI00373659E5
MKKLVTLLFCLMLSSASQAALLTINELFKTNNDVAVVQLELLTDSPLIIFTTSFDYGANFDPIVAFYDNEGNFIAYNDDNEYVAPYNFPEEQTFWDSGLILDLLTGTYYITVSEYPNFPNRNNLFDDPYNQRRDIMPIDDGPQLSLHVIGNIDVDSALWEVFRDDTGLSRNLPTPVPEPSTQLLALLFGLGLIRLKCRV